MAPTTPVTIDTFTSWLENPQSLVDSSEHGEFLQSLAVSSAEPVEQTIAAQNSVPIGDAAPSEAAQGDALNQAKADGDTKKLAEILAASAGNAVTSMLGLAQSSSGWNPQDPDAAKNQQNFTKLIGILLANPLMVIKQRDTKSVHYQESNYNSLIDKVVDLYDGIAGDDIGKIKNSIANLAKASTSRVNTSNTSSLFVQNTLNAAESSDIVIMFQSSTMMMEYSHSSGKGAPKDTYKTEIDVTTIELHFNSAAWTPGMAESLAKKFTQAWDDWLNGTTTPDAPNQADIEFCFGANASNRQRRERPVPAE